MKILVLAVALIVLGVTGIHRPVSAEEKWEPAGFDADELSSLLQAVPMEGSLLLELTFTPYRAQGKLYGCGYSFHVLLRDWAYRENQPTVVYGSGQVLEKMATSLPYLFGSVLTICEFNRE